MKIAGQIGVACITIFCTTVSVQAQQGKVPTNAPAVQAEVASAAAATGAPTIADQTVLVSQNSTMFSYQIVATNSPTSYTLDGASLPWGLTLDTTTGKITAVVVTPTDVKKTADRTKALTIAATNGAGKSSEATLVLILVDKDCWLVPLRAACAGSGFSDKTRSARDSVVNTFYNTSGTFSFFNQVKSIYNGASSAATVSADLATLNFHSGLQVVATTNVQVGATSPTPVSSATIPTLAASDAGKATQDMLSGGTFVASVSYPLVSAGVSGLGSAGGSGLLIDAFGREGVDIQNFKSGTNTNVNSPPSHTSTGIEGYLQYNSINLTPGSTSVFAGAVFVGGSYGYSYTSHDFARDYGFGNQVSNGIGQISFGILINNVAKIVFSRAFGPSQTYKDSTTMAQTKVNNFNSWSFGITYQSNPSASSSK
jgi:hypothetical protein